MGMFWPQKLDTKNNLGRTQYIRRGWFIKKRQGKKFIYHSSTL